MAHNNPQIEKITIWGFTEEEIEHRWLVTQKFDPLTRLFGNDDDDKDKKKNKNPPNNNAAVLSKLESMLTQG